MMNKSNMELDLISRQDAIRIVDNIDTWQAGWRGNAIESMNALPSAHPEPCEDAVSREDVINMIEKRMNQLTQVNFGTRTFQDGIYDGYARIRSDMKSLPSVQPESPEPEELDFVQPHKKVGVRLEIGQSEIVRCRDCKHWDKTWTNDWAEDYHYCPKMDEVRKGDFYCRYAERRTDDGI